MPANFAAATDQRSLPLFLPDKDEKVVRMEIELPDGFRQTDISPKSQHFSAPGGSQARITQTSANGKCVVTDQFVTVPAIVSPKDYPVLLNIQAALGRKSATTFLLERE
jgi:hypothetical protein